MFSLIFGLLFSYLVGSFPTAVVVSNLFFGFDIRTRGSGNMGSTNAFRELGTTWGILVQIVDILKGFVPTYYFPFLALKYVDTNLIGLFGGELAIKLLFGFAAIAGHIWSIFVGFKGGKGINTALGMLLGITPVEVGICLIVFLLVFLSSGIVSLGSLIASFAYPLVILIRHFVLNHSYANFGLLLTFSLLLFILIVFTHRSNIRRILNGTENKFEKFQIIRFKRRK